MTDRLPNLPRKPFVPFTERHGQPLAAFAVWSNDIDTLAELHADYRRKLDAFDNRMARLQADWEGR